MQADIIELKEKMRDFHNEALIDVFGLECILLKVNEMFEVASESFQKITLNNIDIENTDFFHNIKMTPEVIADYYREYTAFTNDTDAMAEQGRRVDVSTLEGRILQLHTIQRAMEKLERLLLDDMLRIQVSRV